MYITYENGRGFFGHKELRFHVDYGELGLMLLRRPGVFDQQLASFRSAGELSGYWKLGLRQRLD